MGKVFPSYLKQSWVFEFVNFNDLYLGRYHHFSFLVELFGEYVTIGVYSRI